jgi:hypothetical protein
MSFHSNIKLLNHDENTTYDHFQNSVNLGEGKAPHVFVVLGASVRVL